jgi:biotin operon repressor
MKVGEVAAKTKVDVTVALKKALAKSPMSEGDLADLLDCSPAKVRATIAAMKAKGAMIINTVDGRYDLANSCYWNQESMKLKVQRTTGRIASVSPQITISAINTPASMS